MKKVSLFKRKDKVQILWHNLEVKQRSYLASTKKENEDSVKNIKAAEGGQCLLSNETKPRMKTCFKKFPR